MMKKELRTKNPAFSFTEIEAEMYCEKNIHKISKVKVLRR